MTAAATARSAGAALRRVSVRAGRAALDMLLPPACLTCDEPVTMPGQLCATCFTGTGFITAPFCVRCGVPFAHAAQGGPAGLCPGCLANPPLFDRARAALRYDMQARRIVLPFKHGDRTETAHALSRHMARAGAALLRDADVLVPVPLHWRRLVTRRYNQAAVLALALGRLSSIQVVPDALRRVRATAQLGERGAEERAREMAAAITARPSRAAQIAGHRVLLIDDVLTSGATADACTVALKQVGAAAVDVLVAARVPDPRLE
jgi:ComF family protein